MGCQFSSRSFSSHDNMRPLLEYYETSGSLATVLRILCSSYVALRIGAKCAEHLLAIFTEPPQSEALEP
jgi:hypothetical protein